MRDRAAGAAEAIAGDIGVWEKRGENGMAEAIGVEKEAPKIGVCQLFFGEVCKASANFLENSINFCSSAIENTFD